MVLNSTFSIQKAGFCRQAPSEGSKSFLYRISFETRENQTVGKTALAFSTSFIMGVVEGSEAYPESTLSCSKHRVRLSSMRRVGAELRLSKKPEMEMGGKSSLLSLILTVASLNGEGFRFDGQRRSRAEGLRLTEWEVDKTYKGQQKSRNSCSWPLQER